MDTFLQTNNDLILSIHKALVESTQEINRKIESLRDDVRDVKLSMAKNDRIMQEEATNWRRHTETIVKELGDRHQNDTSGLHKLLMELCIRSSSAAIGGSFVSGVSRPEMDALANLTEKAAESTGGFLCGGSTIGKPIQFESDNKPTTVAPIVSSTLSIVPTAYAPVVTTAAAASVVTAPVVTTAAASVALPPVITTAAASVALPPVITTAAASVALAPVVTTAADSVAPAPVFTSAPIAPVSSPFFPPSAPIGGSLFGGASRPGTNTFANLAAKASESGGGFLSGGSAIGKPIQFEPDNKPTAVASVISSTLSIAPTVTAPVVTTAADSVAPAPVFTSVPIAPVSSPFFPPSAPIGGSLFGGASRPGTNTFANLAAKASESGGGFLSGGSAIGKPIQFGQTAFGTTNVKDFKLFQQPPTQQSFSSNITIDKTADESYKGEEGSDKEDAADEFVPDVHFEPVVPLPPEVEVSTGEEEEEVFFSARCKLYRFDKDARENKERGLGDIKLLYNSRNDRYRCVMRREQVFKLCANFPIYPDLKIHPREQMPTVYTWACKDFSDDPSQGTDVTLSARFKDKAIADEFYEKMMEAVEKSG